MRTTAIFGLGLLALGAPGAPARAAIVLEVPEGVPGAPTIGGPTHQTLGVGWSSTIGYDNATIRARLYTVNAQANTITAYLTQSIGQNAQPGSQLATATVQAPLSEDWVTLFSGVDLAPGNWYVVLSAPTELNVNGWVNGNGNPQTGAGVTYISTLIAGGPGANTQFAPASIFSTNYPSLTIAVRGTPVPNEESVPEPSNFALGLTGIAASLAWRRYLRS